MKEEKAKNKKHQTNTAHILRDCENYPLYFLVHITSIQFSFLDDSFSPYIETSSLLLKTFPSSPTIPQHQRLLIKRARQDSNL
jgi:hypothetical protein